ncbi:peptidylprolyl isomerase [Chloroflexota bacterium]
MVKKYRGILLAALLFGIVLVTGCAGNGDSLMANDGNTVRVHYTGKLGDGTVFDTSVEREPLEFTVGAGMVIPGFDEAVKALEIGQSTVVTIPADEAYGQYRDDLLMEIEKIQLPENLVPEVGQSLQMQQPDGRAVVVVITGVTETAITIDANHPLAGKDLTFEIELVEILK